MPLKIVRNDITKMKTDAIVNTANSYVEVGPGCDFAIYQAAGFEQLLEYRKKNIGEVPEGEAFLTPGYNLAAKYIIHAVSPLFIDGKSGEEEKLRACYKNSLRLAYENGIESVAFPLISTGSFGYPKEDGMRIAVDEINAFLFTHRMEIILVVFDDKAVSLAQSISPGLESFIDSHFVEEYKEQGRRGENEERREFRRRRESGDFGRRKVHEVYASSCSAVGSAGDLAGSVGGAAGSAGVAESAAGVGGEIPRRLGRTDELFEEELFDEEHESALAERLKHLTDNFQQYLFYLIELKGYTNEEVYHRAIVDKKLFSKIKTNPDYHPKKITALCLCIGAKLNLDETKDLLARAGYALSPCDITDVIFTYFIQHEIYDMIEIDIQLEEHGVPCIIQ